MSRKPNLIVPMAEPTTVNRPSRANASTPSLSVVSGATQSSTNVRRHRRQLRIRSTELASLAIATSAPCVSRAPGGFRLVQGDHANAQSVRTSAPPAIPDLRHRSPQQLFLNQRQQSGLDCRVGFRPASVSGAATMGIEIAQRYGAYLASATMYTARHR